MNKKEFTTRLDVSSGFGDRLKSLRPLLMLLMLIIAASTSFGRQQEQERDGVFGTPIVVAVHASPDVLKSYPQVKVLAFLNDGESVDLPWDGDATKISIPTFGLLATATEKNEGKAVRAEKRKEIRTKDKNAAFVWGLLDVNKRWHRFENLAYIAVQHTPEKKAANFDGYSTELHFKWNNKFWTIVQNDRPDLKIHRFTVDAELRNRVVGGRIEFVLETPSGPSAPPTFPDKITFQLATDNGPTSVQSGRDRELLLPKGTRVTSCQLEPQTEEEYSASRCEWLWPPDQGVAKIIVSSKRADLRIP
jgi:hypothetical protein